MSSTAPGAGDPLYAGPDRGRVAIGALAADGVDDAHRGCSPVPGEHPPRRTALASCTGPHGLSARTQPEGNPP